MAGEVSTPIEAFGQVLQALDRQARPESRFSQHMGRCDMNETWNFARLNPGLLKEVAYDAA